MKKTNLLFALLAFMLFSCKASTNESKGINDILAFYGGKCEYSYGVNTGTDQATTKYFLIKMSGSNVIEHYRDSIGICAANVAFLFYKNLAEEKKKYNEIEVQIVLQNGFDHTFNFPAFDLDRVEQKMTVINKFVDLIKTEKYAELVNMLSVDSEYVKYDKNQILKNFPEAEKTMHVNYGEIEKFVPYGFIYLHSPSGKEVLHISGMLKRPKLSTEFSMDFDMNSETDRVVLFNYKF